MEASQLVQLIDQLSEAVVGRLGPVEADLAQLKTEIRELTDANKESKLAPPTIDRHGPVEAELAQLKAEVRALSGASQQSNNKDPEVNAAELKLGQWLATLALAGFFGFAGLVALSNSAAPELVAPAKKTASPSP